MLQMVIDKSAKYPVTFWKQSIMLNLYQLGQHTYQLLVHDLNISINVLRRLPSLVVRMSNYSGSSNLLRVS